MFLPVYVAQGCRGRQCECPVIRVAPPPWVSFGPVLEKSVKLLEAQKASLEGKLAAASGCREGEEGDTLARKVSGACIRGALVVHRTYCLVAWVAGC